MSARTLVPRRRKRKHRGGPRAEGSVQAQVRVSAPSARVPAARVPAPAATRTANPASPLRTERPEATSFLAPAVRDEAPVETGPFEPELGKALTEEERIESAKYLPRHLPKRLFEEERFLFPESYGVDRVRLLVKDPEWLFAYWDLDQRSVDALRNDVGERTLALTRLTLRIADTGSGGVVTILLPYGARAWYVRADGAPRAYRAQLGWTLPSGEFRPLAESNVAVTPRSGPSPVEAGKRARSETALDVLAEAVPPALAAPQPWGEKPAEPAAPGQAPQPARKKRPKGGASDAYRR